MNNEINYEKLGAVTAIFVLLIGTGAYLVYSIVVMAYEDYTEIACISDKIKLHSVCLEYGVPEIEKLNTCFEVAKKQYEKCKAN